MGQPKKKHKIGDIVYERYPYIVKVDSRGHVVYNVKMNDFDNWHAHIKREKTCIRFIDNLFTRTVPKSSYLRDSALRVCNDKKFIEKVQIKIEKDKQKIPYRNINKGVVK